MVKNKTQVILGIDPGYDRLGWAVGWLNNSAWQKFSYGHFTTDSQSPLFDRYKELAQKLKKIITTHQPTTLAIESLFFFKNKTTALKVSETRGVIIHTCLEAGLEILEYTPLQIKQALTGNGRADKRAMEKMIRLQLHLPNEKVIDDAIDALAVLETYRSRKNIEALN